METNEEVKFSIHGQMTSGINDQEKVVTYQKLDCKKGIYYIANQDNVADNIYFKSNISDEKSEGFGGATLKFTLVDGTIDFVKGPWHSNSTSLFLNTGVDIRDKSFTRGIIALECKPCENWYEGYIYSKVLHYDQYKVLGSFLRINNLAQEFANELNKNVYYAVKTGGGGSAGLIEPIKKD